jgi:hypothetical protein
MKYIIFSIPFLLLSCVGYKPLYDGPTTIVDIAIHGIHCPCDNVEFDEFTLSIKNDSTKYPTKTIKGNNIPKEYRIWIDTSLICETGCRIYIDKIVMRDSNKIFKIKGKYYIDVAGMDYE